MRATLAAGVLLVLCASARGDPAQWTRSMVWIEATAIRHSHYQPWSRSSRTLHKNGLVVGEARILSTAEGLDNATLVRVRVEDESRWRLARVDWLDPHANLALLSTGDDEAWPDTPAAPLASEVPERGPVRIGHFLNGRVVSEPGTVRRVHVPFEPGRIVQHMTLEVAWELGAGAADPDPRAVDRDPGAASQIVAADGRIIGLGAGHDGKRLTVIPAPLIAGVLERKRHDPQATLAAYPFTWQRTEHPALGAWLGRPGPARGVLVGTVPALSAFAAHLRPRDLILSIDGFAIESDGTYRDPSYGYLSFVNLSTRGKFAGDLSTFEIWREGSTLSLDLPLPPARWSDALVPDRIFDRSPEYLVAGGLVFQPFTTDYLRSWGAEWQSAAPFRLRYYRHQSPRPERRSLVILSQVLPDPFNLGYRDLAFRIVDRVNGRPVASLHDLEEALGSPRDGYHLIDLRPERGPTRLVLDAAGLDEATERVLRRYAVPAARVIH